MTSLLSYNLIPLTDLPEQLLPQITNLQRSLPLSFCFLRTLAEISPPLTPPTHLKITSASCYPEYFLADTLKWSIMQCVNYNWYIMNLTLKPTSNSDTSSSLLQTNKFMKLYLKHSSLKPNNLSRTFPLKNVLELHIFNLFGNTQ